MGPLPPFLLCQEWAPVAGLGSKLSFLIVLVLGDRQVKEKACVCMVSL